MTRTALILLIMLPFAGLGCSPGETGSMERETSVLPAGEGEESAPVSFDAPGREKPGQGSEMPEYSVELLDGSSIELSGNQGKARLVNIWATWCGPCRYEIPALIQIQNEHGGDGFEVLGISIDRMPARTRVEDFVEENELNYPIGFDPDGRIADVFDTSLIPTSALIDRTGTIIWFHKGVVSADDADLLAAIGRVLGDQTPG